MRMGRDNLMNTSSTARGFLPGKMQLTLDEQGPLYEQIARALKREILGGRIKAGSKLPSTRTVALALGVTRKSVVHAYELLCAEQLAFARGGSGTRVANIGGVANRKRLQARPPSQYAIRMRKLPALTLAGARVMPPPKYNMQYGEPVRSAAFFNTWRRKLAAAALRAPPGYAPAAGLPALRRALADYLGRRRGIICDASDILVVGGTQEALTLIERVLLDAGDTAVVEDPNYELAVLSLTAHGARIFHGRTDEEGLVVRELPRQSVGLTYVTPSHQFPSGVVMSLQRRLELLSWAASTGCYLFEDDYDSEFHSGEGPLPALRTLDIADRVIYVGSFSKTLFPSLRMGYIVCPKGIRDDLFQAKLLNDLGCPAIDQAALATLIQSRQYEKLLRHSVKEIIDRRRALVEALREVTEADIEIGPHEGGMHLVVWFRNMHPQKFLRFIERAKVAGLGLYPIDPYYHHKPARCGLILGYAGLSSGQLRSAIDLFSRCLQDVMAGHERSAVPLLS